MPVRYEEDFYAWTRETAQALREGRVSDLDLQQVAEEIEDMGKSEKRTLTSHLERIVLHMLKMKYQPGKHSRSWDLSIAESRVRVADELTESPSLRGELPDRIQHAYRIARLGAARQTGLAADLFPEECPFTLKEVLPDV